MSGDQYMPHRFEAQPGKYCHDQACLLKDLAENEVVVWTDVVEQTSGL